MTRCLQEIKISEKNHTVSVTPELIVEVAYSEIQKSSHYKSGFALRFARIDRIREDKTAGNADTIDKMRTL